MKKNLLFILISFFVVNAYAQITFLQLCDMPGSFGNITPDEVEYFLQANSLPEAKMREMNKIKVGKNNVINYNNFKLLLPENWKLTDGYYTIKDTTQRDSVIFTDRISLKKMNLADFYSYMLVELLNVNAIVIPDSIVLEKKGDAICLRYNVMDYTYGELNTCMICMFSNDGINFDILRINAYSDFIQNNIDMIDDIIKKYHISYMTKISQTRNSHIAVILQGSTFLSVSLVDYSTAFLMTLHS